MNVNALLQNTGDGVSAVGPDGKILFWNNSAEAILKYPAKDVIGQPCWDVFASCDVNGNRLCSSRCTVRTLLGQGETVRHFEMATRTRTGAPVWIDVSTLYDPGTGGRSAALVHLFRDVTAAHEVDSLVRERLAERLAESTEAQGQGRQARLTQRERQVIQLMHKGARTAAIAKACDISPATVRNHVQNILRKLQVHSRLEAIARANGRHL